MSIFADYVKFCARRSRSDVDQASHHLNKLQWALDPNTTYQVSRQSVHWFQRRRFFK